MRYAIINNEVVEPEKTGQRAICRCCNEELISKCGDIKEWHWSHKSNSECDLWYEHKTKWHIDWQDKFPKENREVIFRDKETDEKHIADVFINDIVYEFQHSPISIKEVKDRTEFYTKTCKYLIWVFDYTHKPENIQSWKLSNVKTHYSIKYKPKHFELINIYDNCLLIIDCDKPLVIINDDLCLEINREEIVDFKTLREKVFKCQRTVYSFDRDMQYRKIIKDLETHNLKLNSYFYENSKLKDDINKVKQSNYELLNKMTLMKRENENIEMRNKELLNEILISKRENEILKKEVSWYF